MVKKMQGVLDTSMHDIHRYVDSICDILEHKFLVFLFNEENKHWVTMVVVNPSAIFINSHAAEKNSKSTGWFFF